MTRPAHIVHFFRDVHGIYPITKPALAQRTKEYQHWVEAFARNHHIPLEWTEKDMKKKGLKQEDYARLRGLESTLFRRLAAKKWPLRGSRQPSAISNQQQGNCTGWW